MAHSMRTRRSARRQTTIRRDTLLMSAALELLGFDPEALVRDLGCGAHVASHVNRRLTLASCRVILDLVHLRDCGLSPDEEEAAKDWLSVVSYRQPSRPTRTTRVST